MNFIFNNALNYKIIIKEYKQENNVKILSIVKRWKSSLNILFIALMKTLITLIEKEYYNIRVSLLDTTKLVRNLMWNNTLLTQNHILVL
ncbi:hypothetical protein HYD77_00860 [Mycoplasmopsis bovis]|nr:hypothetical protein [Mycoplasmopsis bovis]QQH43517.1 hypothetical protein HYD77_00860 [Mycoplasmopsis bovis]